MALNIKMAVDEDDLREMSVLFRRIGAAFAGISEGFLQVSYSIEEYRHERRSRKRAENAQKGKNRTGENNGQ